VIFNVIGGFIWAIGLTTLGYYMGQIDVVKNNIEIAIVVVIALSLTPVVIELVKHRREAKRVAEDALADITE
jgi:membrane-associated protein